MSANALNVAETVDVSELTFREGTDATTYTANTEGEDAEATHTIAYGDNLTATFEEAVEEDVEQGIEAKAAGYYTDGELVLEADEPLAQDATGTIDATEAGYYNDGGELVVATEEASTTGEVTTGINISSQENADGAITTIQTAIDNVSAERSKLGALQNRLDHTINNLGTSAENITAAESRIRDVDYDLVAA